MRLFVNSVAAAVAALAAAPASAQVGVGVGVGGDVRVGTGAVVDDLRGTLDRTVETTDRTVNRALGSDVVVATRADVRSGVVVRNNRGRRVGTVHHVEGNSVLVVRGNRHMWVPLASLYRSGTGLVTSLSRAELYASGNTRAEARSSR